MMVGWKIQMYFSSFVSCWISISCSIYLQCFRNLTGISEFMYKFFIVFSSFWAARVLEGIALHLLHYQYLQEECWGIAQGIGALDFWSPSLIYPPQINREQTPLHHLCSQFIQSKFRGRAPSGLRQIPWRQSLQPLTKTCLNLYDSGLAPGPELG